MGPIQLNSSHRLFSKKLKKKLENLATLTFHSSSPAFFPRGSGTRTCDPRMPSKPLTITTQIILLSYGSQDKDLLILFNQNSKGCIFSSNIFVISSMASPLVKSLKVAGIEPRTFQLRANSANHLAVTTANTDCESTTHKTIF